jgi:hypothetical protein
MSDWSGKTRVDVAAIATAAQGGAVTGIPRIYRAVSEAATWGPIPSEGVFDSFGDTPTWSARVSWSPRAGGQAVCDIRVFDRGDLREVQLDRNQSRGLGARSKNLLEGIVDALKKQDSRIGLS